MADGRRHRFDVSLGVVGPQPARLLVESSGGGKSYATAELLPPAARVAFTARARSDKVLQLRLLVPSSEEDPSWQELARAPLPLAQLLPPESGGGSELASREQDDALAHTPDTFGRQHGARVTRLALHWSRDCEGLVAPEAVVITQPIQERPSFKNLFGLLSGSQRKAGSRDSLSQLGRRSSSNLHPAAESARQSSDSAAPADTGGGGTPAGLGTGAGGRDAAPASRQQPPPVPVPEPAPAAAAAEPDLTEEEQEEARRDFLALILTTLASAPSIDSEASLSTPTASQLAAAASLPRAPSVAELHSFAATTGLPIQAVKQAASKSRLAVSSSSGAAPASRGGSFSRRSKPESASISSSSSSSSSSMTASSRGSPTTQQALLSGAPAPPSGPAAAAAPAVAAAAGEAATSGAQAAADAASTSSLQPAAAAVGEPVVSVSDTAPGTQTVPAGASLTATALAEVRLPPPAPATSGWEPQQLTVATVSAAAAAPGGGSDRSGQLAADGSAQHPDGAAASTTAAALLVTTAPADLVPLQHGAHCSKDPALAVATASTSDGREYQGDEAEAPAPPVVQRSLREQELSRPLSASSPLTTSIPAAATTTTDAGDDGSNHDVASLAASTGTSRRSSYAGGSGDLSKAAASPLQSLSMRYNALFELPEQLPAAPPAPPEIQPASSAEEAPAEPEAPPPRAPQLQLPVGTPAPPSSAHDPQLTAMPRAHSSRLAAVLDSTPQAPASSSSLSVVGMLAASTASVAGSAALATAAAAGSVLPSIATAGVGLAVLCVQQSAGVIRSATKLWVRLVMLLVSAPVTLALAAMQAAAPRRWRQPDSGGSTNAHATHQQHDHQHDQQQQSSEGPSAAASPVPEEQEVQPAAAGPGGQQGAAASSPSWCGHRGAGLGLTKRPLAGSVLLAASRLRTGSSLLLPPTPAPSLEVPNSLGAPERSWSSLLQAALSRVNSTSSNDSVGAQLAAGDVSGGSFSSSSVPAGRSGLPVLTAPPRAAFALGALEGSTSGSLLPPTQQRAGGAGGAPSAAASRVQSAESLAGPAFAHLRQPPPPRSGWVWAPGLAAVQLVARASDVLVVQPASTVAGWGTRAATWVVGVLLWWALLPARLTWWWGAAVARWLFVWPARLVIGSSSQHA